MKNLEKRCRYHKIRFDGFVVKILCHFGVYFYYISCTMRRLVSKISKNIATHFQKHYSSNRCEVSTTFATVMKWIFFTYCFFVS